MKKTILSLGGSIIIPGEIQTEFLGAFRTLIEEKVGDGYEFVIFCGGGNTARLYQGAAKELAGADDEQLDWLGIRASWLNAHLMKTVFGELAYDDIIVDPTEERTLDKPITIGGGWKPGWSTDYDAVTFAAKHDFDRVVNLSNITHAYDKDPSKHDDAEKIEDITWDDFRKIVGDEWKPGLNMPFDPIASKMAQEENIDVIIANGTNLPNLRAILEGSDFEGTHIHN